MAVQPLLNDKSAKKRAKAFFCAQKALNLVYFLICDDKFLNIFRSESRNMEIYLGTFRCSLCFAFAKSPGPNEGEGGLGGYLPPSCLRKRKRKNGLKIPENVLNF